MKTDHHPNITGNVSGGQARPDIRNEGVAERIRRIGLPSQQLHPDVKAGDARQACGPDCESPALDKRRHKRPDRITAEGQHWQEIAWTDCKASPPHPRRRVEQQECNDGPEGDKPCGTVSPRAPPDHETGYCKEKDWREEEE